MENPVKGEHIVLWDPLDGNNSVAICEFRLKVDRREKSVRILVSIAIQDNIVVAICWKGFVEKLDKG